MEKTELYFKVLDGKKSCHGGDAVWKLRQWQPAVEVSPCESGYHLCRPQDLVCWLGKDIYLAEGRGKKVECHNKVVFEQARIIRRLEGWNEASARLFACWCVRQVWHLLTDARGKDAVRVAERFAKGMASKEELDAARAAAWAAARDAAWAAAQAAARATARDAAWDAAQAAARATAWAAAQATAQAKQTKRLMKILGF